MKTALILVGAVALVLISKESSASGSPTRNEAIKSRDPFYYARFTLSNDLIDNKGLVRQKRGTGGYLSRCRSDSDCNGMDCSNRRCRWENSQRGGGWLEEGEEGWRCQWDRDCRSGLWCQYFPEPRGKRCQEY